MLRWLHAAGVDLQQAGSIYLDVEVRRPHCRSHPLATWTPQYQKLQTSMTPIMIARQMLKQLPSLPVPPHPHPGFYSDLVEQAEGWHEAYTESVRFLQECQPKRERSTQTLEERAVQVGVLARLKPVCESLRMAAQGGSVDAKKELQKLQIANQQIVSRAEKRAGKKQCTTRVE